MAETSNLLASLRERRLCAAPDWLPGALHYLAYVGSMAYGCSSDSSDLDCYGIAIPRRDLIFPHLQGKIPGFGAPPQTFEVWQQAHLVDPATEKEYDFQVYSLVKFCQLAMENNPNILDALFVPHTCVLFSTPIGQRLRTSRKLFLHKGAWHRFKGYAYSQLKRLSSLHVHETVRQLAELERAEGIDVLHHGRQPREEPDGAVTVAGRQLDPPVAARWRQHYQAARDGGLSDRERLVLDHGYDVKFGYHVVRLLLEVEQILAEGDLDLQRHKEQLKAIRRGEWSEARLRQWVADKEGDLERLYATSSLPSRPDEAAIKRLLLECLEQHYGTLEGAYHDPGIAIETLREIHRAAGEALAKLEGAGGDSP